MGSLGDRDDEIQPGKRNSILDRCDNNETQPLDSQSSPPSPYGKFYKSLSVSTRVLINCLFFEFCTQRWVKNALALCI